MVDDGDSSLREGIADSKQRTSTAVYGDDEESNVGLIEKSRRSEGQDNDEDESDLEKAVVDILSCCTGNLNTNQAKILQDMQGRINEKGNLLDDIGDISDQFDDECSNKQFIKSKLSPRQWIRNLQPKVEGPISTDQPFIRALPEKEKKKRPSILLICAVGAIMLILLTLLVVIAMKKKNSKKGTGNIQYVHSKDGVGAPTADCHLVTTQKHPSPLSQCECDGKITKIFPETNKKYDQLKEAFGENYLKANETMDSCSARNQALVWLAEDGASLHSELLVQRHSLALFYIKMHGLYWELEERQKWMTPDHECTWFGVACNDNMEVVAVELWNVNLDGSIPKELMSLTSLERLSLPENKIHGHLPDEMFRFMNKLTDLTLFMNSLSGNISPGIFEYVANLKLLNLDSNDLTGEIPTEVGLLSKLESLKVCALISRVEAFLSGKSSHFVTLFMVSFRSPEITFRGPYQQKSAI